VTRGISRVNDGCVCMRSMKISMWNDDNG